MKVIEVQSLDELAASLNEEVPLFKEWIADGRLPVILIRGEYFVEKRIARQMYIQAYEDGGHFDPPEKCPTMAQYESIVYL